MLLVSKVQPGLSTRRPGLVNNLVIYLLCLGGLDQHLLKNSAFTESLMAFPIRKMKYSVTPLVREINLKEEAPELPIPEDLNISTRSDQLIQEKK